MSTTNIVRNHVRIYLMEEIKRGKIRIGQALNLAELARELKVSVTPVREALSQLELTGIIKAVPNKGFVIPELSFVEAKDLYETIAQVQIIALESTPFDAHTIRELRKEQKQLQQTHTPNARLKSRINLHHLLTKNCPNKILVNFIRNLEGRILFYEQMYLTDASFYELIDNQNDGIIDAIEEDNLPTAALILKLNWLTILDHIQKKMQQPQVI
ncbi:MAG: GntR family transcriptional regulator [Croceitalea sp.]|nr:GntR family transcriptional regulator [Croceitalea sp.]